MNRPRLLTVRQCIRTVAKRWREQYPGPQDVQGTRGDTWRALRALDVEAATVEDVARIIGNDSWTSIKCDACGRYDCELAVEVGELADYETRTATLCAGCLLDAADLLPGTVAAESDVDK
jgi:hypothetical protein